MVKFKFITQIHHQLQHALGEERSNFFSGLYQIVRDRDRHLLPLWKNPSDLMPSLSTLCDLQDSSAGRQQPLEGWPEILWESCLFIHCPTEFF